MKAFGATVNTVLAASILLVALAGCQKQDGPRETAGKELDKATQNLGKSIEKTGENIQDAAKGKK